MRFTRRFLLWFFGALLINPVTTVSVAAAEKIGIFELIHVAETDFEQTAARVEEALRSSPLTLHARHDLTVPDGQQSARLFVLTSPTLSEVTAGEPPETISGQILRVAVYTHGESPGTLINMANPVAHAMVFYSDSKNYDALVKAAQDTAEQIRMAISGVPGTAVSHQRAPLRTSKHYRKYKGDGPARMMTKFRNWKKSQLTIRQEEAENFSAVVDEVAARLSPDTQTSVADESGWQRVAMIPLREDAVYFGVTNRFTEDKMIRINSDFRKDGKTESAPYPGVDHAAALPLDVLVVKRNGRTEVLHYGQMWRMQLYFWDSGYRAFTKNTMIPGAISKSIEALLTD